MNELINSGYEFDFDGFDLSEDDGSLTLVCRGCEAPLYFTVNADPDLVEAALAEHTEGSTGRREAR